MTKIKGFKVFKPDWTCRDFQYKVGKTYKIDGELQMCNNGFHFCTKPADCFNYYGFNSNNKVAEIEAVGKVLTSSEDSKCVTDKIKIVREIGWHEVLDIVNTGNNNTGLSNSGDMNSGNSNSGNSNSGDMNSGDRNSGYMNSGYMNSGNSNSGNSNSGNSNSGNSNSGNMNSGNSNSGNSNSGNSNSGDMNSGDRNSGDSNSGDMNSGDSNSGYRNSGDFNSCNYSSGVFCIETPKLLMFDKPTDMTLEDWRNSEPCTILRKFALTEWINEDDMTDEEKEQHEEYKTIGGYLRTYTYKEAWGNLWNSLDIKEKDIIQRIPNFSKDKFYEITGIKIK
jgi:hypothetical protein